MKKNIGIGTLVSIAAAMIVAIFETSLHPTTAENLYMLAGLGIIVFGVWASVLLIKDK